ncbi:MAG: hypothetical protein AB1626_04205 [Candidatus Micrarchaeota archaeon]
MNVTLSLPNDLAAVVKTHPEIKWTQVMREAVAAKAERMMKVRLLEKYLDHEPFTDDEIAWMDEHDWHPVDERELKPEFSRELAKRSKGRFVKAKSVEDLFA